jgi:hypothetical protein
LVDFLCPNHSRQSYQNIVAQLVAGTQAMAAFVKRHLKAGVTQTATSGEKPPLSIIEVGEDEEAADCGGP